MATFVKGDVVVKSYVKSNHLFTANEQIIAYKTGTLTTNKINEVIK